MINIGFDTNTSNEDFILDIRDKNQVIKARYAINSNDIEKNVLMSEHYIEFSFKYDRFIAFVRSDYIEWQGEKYIIREDYTPDQESESHYSYTLRFDHWTTLLQDDTFYYTNQGLQEAEWSLTSNAATHFQLLADNANRYFGVNTFNIGTIEFSEIKFLTFSKISIWDAATQIANAYNGEWHLTGTTFHLVKKFSYGSEVELEIGVSVDSIDRSKGEDSERYSRILALGSTRNIPANYRETTPGEAVDAIYQKRLRIPQSKGSFIDIATGLSPEQIKSAVVIFEEVYPKRIGTISSVSTVEYTDTNTDTGEVTTWNAYRYKDTGLQFKSEYLLPGVELRLVFQSGNLNGMDFALKFNPLGKPETDPESQIFEIVRNEDYGKALPNDTMKPQNGDTYILYGFNIALVSDQYVPAAEQELFEEGERWLIENNRDKSVFECSTMLQYFEDNEMDLEIGQKVKLVNDQFEGGSRSSRIQGYEKSLLYKYQATYTVGDNAKDSWRSNIEESIKELQIAGNTYQATGGNGVYVIKRFDSTPASDFNTFSALRAKYEFLSRINDDTVQGFINFIKGLYIGDFASGMFGSGGTFRMVDGSSEIEVDKLTVRKWAKFFEVMIERATHIGGSNIISAARMICSGVEESVNYYRCYFETGDNNEFVQEFVIGDQARCQVFTGSGQKYYWRLVTGIGENYIDLSKTDSDSGSGIPAEGDHIFQLGNRTNEERQNAQVFSSFGSDAPSYKQYQGINSYSLEGKEINVISSKGNKSTGIFTFLPGSTGGQNIEGLISGSVNLLRNSGFTGDYEDIELTPSTELKADTKLYSQNLKYWDGTATVNTDTESKSGYSASLNSSSISQSVSNLVFGENYIISFKAKGSNVNVIFSGLNKVITLTNSYKQYTFKTTAATGIDFVLAGTCSVCEIYLKRGTIEEDWDQSPLDNNKALAEFQGMRYLTDAVKNASTSILGGLILSNIIQLGNYVNGKMKEVTSGISGVYNDESDVSYWAGGTLDQAIATVLEFADNPNANVPESEWQKLANAVITHGGRIIANDAIIRGNIYATDGVFKGTVYAHDGEFTGKVSSNNGGDRIVIDSADRSLKMISDEEIALLINMYGSGGIVTPRIFMKDTSSGHQYSTSPRSSSFYDPSDNTRAAFGKFNDKQEVFIGKSGDNPDIEIDTDNARFRAYINILSATSSNLSLFANNLPTSANGLKKGQIWRDGENLKIVP